MRNVPFADAILATEALRAKDLEQSFALCIQNMTEHLLIEHQEEKKCYKPRYKLTDPLSPTQCVLVSLGMCT